MHENELNEMQWTLYKLLVLFCLSFILKMYNHLVCGQC